MCERGLETEQNCKILTPTLLAITTFLSRSPALLNRGHGGPASLGHVPQFSIFSPTGLIPNWLIGSLRAPSAWYWLSLPHLVSNWSGLQTAQSGAWGLPLLGAGFLYRILSPTDRISCALCYIIVQHPPSSCGRHKLHSFNLYTVKVILCYSSTGCTCYLHRCISYFDSPGGS